MNTQNYICNKLVSALATVGIISLLVLVMPHEQAGWKSLILAIIFFGQGHFLVSYWYYFTSKKRTDISIRGMGIFALFLAITTYGLYMYWTISDPTILMFGLAAHFVIHNFLNERTMLERYVGYTCSPLGLWVVTMWAVAFYAQTVSSTSLKFYYSQSVIFLENFTSFQQIGSIPVGGDYMSLQIFFIALSLVLTILYVYQYIQKGYRSLLEPCVLGLAAVITLVSFIFSFNISFVVSLAAIIIYHYITWILFGYDMGRESGSHKSIFTRNIVCYVLLGIVFFMGNTIEQGKWLYALFFSGQAFMLWTFVHINFTLINETPVFNFLKRI